MASSSSSNKGDFKKDPKQIFPSSVIHRNNPGTSGQESSGGTSESPPSASGTADSNKDPHNQRTGAVTLSQNKVGDIQPKTTAQKFDTSFSQTGSGSEADQHNRRAETPNLPGTINSAVDRERTTKGTKTISELPEDGGKMDQHNKRGETVNSESEINQERAVQGTDPHSNRAEAVNSPNSAIQQRKPTQESDKVSVSQEEASGETDLHNKRIGTVNLSQDVQTELQPEPTQETRTISEIPEGAGSKTGLDFIMTVVWKSNNIRDDWESSVNIFEFKKWCFLLEKPGLTKKILDKIKDKTTGITSKKGTKDIKVKFCCRTTFKNDTELKQWSSECYERAEEVFSDLLLVFIRCGLQEIEVIRNVLSQKTLCPVKVIESKKQIPDGVYLVGEGESLATIISDICKMGHLKDVTIVDPETKQEIEISIIPLDSLQIRCLNHLDLENRLREKFPLVKTYSDSGGTALKLIGIKEDVRQEEEFIRNNKWLDLYHQEKCDFDKEIIEFLSQEAVQKFLDTEIQKKEIGTWIISDSKKSVIAFGVDDKNAKEVAKTLCQSFATSSFQITGKEKILKLWERATEYKKKTNGKFSMHIGQPLNKTFKEGQTEIRFHYTDDLLNDKDLINLIEKKKNKSQSTDVAEEMVVLTPLEFFLIKEMEKNNHLGLSKDVHVEFGEESTLILRGEKVSVAAEKKYIEGLNLVQKSVILPQSLTMHQNPENLCYTYHCVLHKNRSFAMSRIWFLNKCVVMVYQGEPMKELSVDARAHLILSDGDKKGTSALGTRPGKQPIITITLPTTYDGKGMHTARGSFEDAYKKMLQFKARSILIPLKTEGNSWTTIRLVKALLYPLLQPSPQELITVILYTSDPNQCKAANEVIQLAMKDPDTCKKVQPSRIEFEVKTGELAKEKVDVIVNSVPNDLNLKYGAVSASLFNAAADGSEFQRELKEKNKFKNTAKFGELFETKSHGLACENIFHGALKERKTSEDYSEKILQTFVTSCLKKASEHKFSTLAFPALGTGRLKFPPDVVAELMKKTVRQFEREHPDSSIKKIVFIIYHKDVSTLKVFQDIFGEVKNEGDMVENKTEADFTGENALEEVAICGRKDDVENVVQELNLQFQTKFYPVSMRKELKEPENLEIPDRTGKENSDELTAGADQTYHKGQNFKDTTKELDDTKCCRIAICPDIKTLKESSKSWRIKPRAIICPYKRENEALVVFSIWKDAEDFSNDPGELQVRNLEQQAVQKIEAQISEECLSLLHNCDIEEKLIASSGVSIKKSNNKWILFGNLPQIELAHNCLQDMISDIKRNRPIPTVIAPKNPKASTVDSSLLPENCKISIKMSEKDYWRYTYMFPPSGEERGANFKRYSSEDQSLHVSGTNSFVKQVENQAKNLFVKEVKINRDTFKLMQADIQNIEKENQHVRFYFDENIEILEVFGMSDTKVKSVVKSLEGKREDLMKKQKSKESSRQGNRTNTGSVQASGKKMSKDFVPHKILKYPGNSEYILRPKFKMSLVRGDILKSCVDAICCGQDPYLQSKGHIAKSIINQKNIGKKLSEAGRKHVYLKGEVIRIECTAYPPKCFLFVVTESPSAKDTTEEILRSIKMCFLSVLEFSDQNNIKSLALPLLGTGNKGAPTGEIAHMWFESVLEFLKKDNLKLQEVHLVNKDYNCLKTVEDCFDEHCRIETGV